MSGRVAIIDHSYHATTRSTRFLPELLSRRLEVEEIAHDGWNVGKAPDLRHLDGSYSAVVFLQLISEEMLEQVRCPNVIFVPMFDTAVNESLGFWEALWRRGVRVLNFSAHLHESCVRLGLDSLCVKYYPEPAPTPAPAREVSVFFWERVSAIDLALVLTLTCRSLESLHHHRAPDPLQPKREVLPRLVRGLRYTSSQWFKDRQGYIEKVREKSVYIAPRPFEGIGMSYLEAMAMGKAVVAADNPTMNEYIVNGGNGYLFDMGNPAPIDFTDIARVGANAYESVCRGFEQWQGQRTAILDWIGTPRPQGSSRLFDLCSDFPRIRDLGMLDLTTAAARRSHQLPPGAWREPPGGSILKQTAWFARFLLRSRGWMAEDMLSFVFWKRALSLPVRRLGRRLAKIGKRTA